MLCMMAFIFYENFGYYLKLTIPYMLQVAGLESALGTEHYWAMMLSLSLIPALIQYLVLPFCPESPRYLLINKGEMSKAEAGGYHCHWHYTGSGTWGPDFRKSGIRELKIRYLNSIDPV